MTWSGENQRWKINGALEWYFCFVIWLPVNEQVLWNSPSIPLAFSIPVTRVPNQLTYSSITGRNRGNLWDTNIIWSTNCFIDWVTMEVEETPRAVEWPKEHCKIHQPLTSSRGRSFINVCQREIAPRRAGTSSSSFGHFSIDCEKFRLDASRPFVLLSVFQFLCPLGWLVCPSSVSGKWLLVHFEERTAPVQSN